ncbi:hypothetical protein BJ912DRAFT_865120, partial [Pholiota molesta]
GWVDEVEELNDEDQEELMKSIRPVSRMLVKLRKVAFKIIHSTTILLPAWKSCLKAADLAIKLMPRDVATRWNSTYDMLVFAVEHKKQIGDLTSDLGNDLRAYKLTREEWKIAEDLRDTLKKTLNRYYSRTDDAEVYRIAMILHPAYKLEYFRAANWEAEWIQTAEELVRSEFDRNYSVPLTSTTNH